MKNQTKKFSVIVFNWIKGVLTKTEKIFQKLEDAKDFAEDQDGDVKIYNEKNEVILSEKKDKKDKKEKKDKKDKKDHPHDDDDEYC